MSSSSSAPAAKPVYTQVRITSKRRVDYAFELRELLSRRDLVRYLTSSMLKAGHRQMLLGELWWLLDPIFHMLVYVFLVTVIFQRGMPYYPVFIFCAILPYRWFTQAVSQSQSVLTSLSGLMRDVAFPKSVYPIALNNSNLINFLFGFLFLIVLAVWYGLYPTVYWLWLIPLIAQFYVFTLAVSLLASAATFLFQDLKNIMVFVFQLTFYLSPSLYSVEHVPEKFRTIYQLNPFSIVFTAWRDVLIYQRNPEWLPLLVLSVISGLMLVLAFRVFVRLEKIFPKLV